MLHYVIIAGVISFAVAIEETIAHPGEHLELAGVIALVLGVALFVGGTAAAVVRAGVRLPKIRIGALAVLVAAAPLLYAVPATTAMTLVALLVATVAAFEHGTRRDRARTPVPLAD